MTTWDQNLTLGSAGVYAVQSSNYVSTCTTLGTNAYAIESSGRGICMQNYDCAYKFCGKANPFNLPSTTVDVRSISDIQLALATAIRVNKTVSIKSTGHSYQGSSTFDNSILIWTHNYPKNGTIVQNYTTSCGTVYDAVVSINAGEIWDDVLESVGNKYHAVTGGGRSVGTIGGWLQGGGMSFSSRRYGLGVDQVVDLQVVLANGTVVRTDACTHPDLFWALRGGGGGTFGVVVQAHYLLHPISPVQKIRWEFLGVDYASKNNSAGLVQVVTQFINYWVRKSPTLDSRWGGYFFATGFDLVFMGSTQDAWSTFLFEFNSWYSSTLNIAIFETGKWGAYPPTYPGVVQSFDSWYDYKGGKAAYRNAAMTDQTGTRYAGISIMAARLVPQSIVEQEPDKVAALLMDVILTNTLGDVNYFLGGVMQNVSSTATSVHPAMRKAVWSVYTFSDVATNKVRTFFPNSVTGVDFNHHNVLEPDWRNACWGDNYNYLASLKTKYDPNGLLKCWHCIGYTGSEGPSGSSASSIISGGGNLAVAFAALLIYIFL